MNLDDAIVLETFSNRIEAEMAAGLLESEGIEAMVMADDAGGTYPMLQFIRGVRLMVFKEDEARAIGADAIILCHPTDRLALMSGLEKSSKIVALAIKYRLDDLEDQNKRP